MRIAKQEVTPSVEAYEAEGGDRITVSISHQVRIEGSECWVKYEIGHTITDDEYGDVTEISLINHASRQVIVLAESAAKEVMDR